MENYRSYVPGRFCFLNCRFDGFAPLLYISFVLQKAEVKLGISGIAKEVVAPFLSNGVLPIDGRPPIVLSFCATVGE
jgi:hypothetical protein